MASKKKIRRQRNLAQQRARVTGTRLREQQRVAADATRDRDNALREKRTLTRRNEELHTERNDLARRLLDATTTLDRLRHVDPDVPSLLATNADLVAKVDELTRDLDDALRTDLDRTSLYAALCNTRDSLTTMAERMERGEDEPVRSEQVEKLATWITENVPGEPSQPEGAVDTAIRIIEHTRRAHQMALADWEQRSAEGRAQVARLSETAQDLRTRLTTSNREKYALRDTVAALRSDLAGANAAADAARDELRGTLALLEQAQNPLRSKDDLFGQRYGGGTPGPIPELTPEQAQAAVDSFTEQYPALSQLDTPEPLPGLAEELVSVPPAVSQIAMPGEPAPPGFVERLEAVPYEGPSNERHIPPRFDPTALLADGPLSPSQASKTLARTAGFLMGVTEVLSPSQALECLEAIEARGPVPARAKAAYELLIQPAAAPPPRSDRTEFQKQLDAELDAAGPPHLAEPTTPGDTWGSEGHIAPLASYVDLETGDTYGTTPPDTKRTTPPHLAAFLAADDLPSDAELDDIDQVLEDREIADSYGMAGHMPSDGPAPHGVPWDHPATEPDRQPAPEGDPLGTILGMDAGPSTLDEHTGFDDLTVAEQVELDPEHSPTFGSTRGPGWRDTEAERAAERTAPVYDDRAWVPDAAMTYTYNRTGLIELLRDGWQHATPEDDAAEIMAVLAIVPLAISSDET